MLYNRQLWLYEKERCWGDFEIALGCIRINSGIKSATIAEKYYNTERDRGD